MRHEVVRLSEEASNTAHLDWDPLRPWQASCSFPPSRWHDKHSIATHSHAPSLTSNQLFQVVRGWYIYTYAVLLRKDATDDKCRCSGHTDETGSSTGRPWFVWAQFTYDLRSTCRKSHRTRLWGWRLDYCLPGMECNYTTGRARSLRMDMKPFCFLILLLIGWQSCRSDSSARPFPPASPQVPRWPVLHTERWCLPCPRRSREFIASWSTILTGPGSRQDGQGARTSQGWRWRRP